MIWFIRRCLPLTIHRVSILPLVFWQGETSGRAGFFGSSGHLALRLNPHCVYLNQKTSRMKPSLFALALLFASVCPIDRVAAQPPAPAAGTPYQQFIAQLVTPENLTDCIARMDAVIDEEEHLAAISQGAPQGLDAETKIGLHFSFRIVIGNDAVIYYLVVSRNGRELVFTDAAKLAALFCDRAGLPHPVAITEGEKPVFYAEWLIKHSDWKAMKKMMAKVRAQNRSEKDPQQAFVIAINREIAAREATPPANP
jgi:hypothetical protein